VDQVLNINFDVCPGLSEPLQSEPAVSLVDSEAAFAAHCNAIDLAGDLKKVFLQNDSKNFSKVAFALGTPQVPPSDGLRKEEPSHPSSFFL